MTGGNLLRALVYLRLTSLRNLLVSRLRRIRQPRYMVGAVVGIAYFYFVFLRRFTTHPRPVNRPPGPLQDLGAGGPQLFALLGAVMLLVFVVLCWALRRQRAALAFTEAEIAFLFPAPVSRRNLIHYRLISAGMAAVFTALILGLVSASWPGISGSFGVRALGWWLVFATLSLHTIGSGFTITRWLDRGASPLRCQVLAWVVCAIVIGLPLLWLWQGVRAGTVSGVDDLQSGPVAWLLLPFRLLLGPLLAAEGHSFLRALLPALLLYALHYVWVLQAQVGFEEASIAKAEKRAAVLAAMRAGNWRTAGKRKARRAPFDLGRAGRPEMAFLWKNLLAAAEYLRLRNALILAVLIVSGCTFFADSPLFNSVRAPLAMFATMIAAYTLLLGPQLARQDFRSDLPNTDILKTYPLRGWQIMLGEMLTPVAILTVVIWLMLLTAALLFPPGMRRMEWLTPQVRTGAALGLALLAPLLCMSQLVIVNAAAVLFPAWQAGPGRAQQQGIEVMGQRMLFLAAQLLAMLAMLLPAIFVAGLGLLLSHWLVGDGFIGAGVALVLAVGTLAVEVGLAILWLGDRFEKLDLSSELRP